MKQGNVFEYGHAGGHATVKCSCGVTISDCRCATPGKMIRTITNGCAACRKNVEKPR